MAFASIADLQSRLGRNFTAAESLQVLPLLDDATAHLQAMIGWQVSPPVAVTFTVYDHTAGLPGNPADQNVTATIEGVAQIGIRIRNGVLTTTGLQRALFWAQTPVTVTYTVGYVKVPAELVSWACVLTSQALAHVQQGGAFGSTGVQSERVDDYAVNYATTGDGAAAFNVPALAAEQLRARYGGGTYVTSSR